MSAKKPRERTQTLSATSNYDLPFFLGMTYDHFVREFNDSDAFELVVDGPRQMADVD